MSNTIAPQQPLPTHDADRVYHFYADVVKDNPGREIIRIHKGEISVLNSDLQPIANFKHEGEGSYGLFETSVENDGTHYKFYSDADQDGTLEVLNIDVNEGGAVADVKRSSDPEEVYYSITPHIFSSLNDGDLLNGSQAGPHKKVDLGVLGRQLNEKRAELRAQGLPGVFGWNTTPHVYGYAIENDRIVRIEIRRESGMSLGYVKQIVDDKTGEILRSKDAGTDASSWPSN